MWHIWKHAHLGDPLENIQPTDHSWKEVNGVFLPLWFMLYVTMEPEDVPDGDEDDDDDDDDEGNVSKYYQC